MIADDTLTARFTSSKHQLQVVLLNCIVINTAAETLERYKGRAANELMAHAKSGNKRRLENTSILSSDLQSDSLFDSFAAGSRPIRFSSRAGSHSCSRE